MDEDLFNSDIEEIFKEDDSTDLSGQLQQAYLTLLNNVLISNKLLSQEVEEHEIISLLLSISRLIIDFNAGAVFIIENGQYHQVVGMDITPVYEEIRDIYLNEHIYDWAIDQKRILVMPEGERNTHILVPLITEKSNIGIVDLLVSLDADTITNQDLDLLWVVASNASSRCELVKLNRWSGLVNVLLSTLEKINSSEQLDNLFDSILKGLDQLLHCKKYLLLTIKDQYLSIKSRYDNGQSYCIPLAYKNKCNCVFVEKALLNQQNLRVPQLNEASECGECKYLYKRPEQESYLMVVPLIIKDTPYGVISVIDNSYNSKLFNEDSTHIIDIFANQVKIAIYQTNLREELQHKNETIHREIEMAGVVQQSLLPEILNEDKSQDSARFLQHYNSDKFSITGFYLPCSTLGGDFYDIIQSDNDLFFSIADVSGHGLSSSLITALFKMSFHKFITNKESYSTQEICKLMNNDLCKFIKTGDYVTSIIGSLSLNSFELSFSGAGHPYPIYYNARENSFNFLQANGVPFAMIENQKYPIKTVQLSPGDKLLLYTDGITEAIDSSMQMYRKESLLESLNKHIKTSDFTLLKNIYSDLQTFTKDLDFKDDISMLIIECKE